MILHSCYSYSAVDYNVSIRVLEQYVKTQHPGNFTTSDLYYNRFSQLGKPSVYHTPRRPQLQFYDIMFSLVIIRLLGHWVSVTWLVDVCRRYMGAPASAPAVPGTK